MESRSTSKPNTRTSPASARTSEERIRISVDFPEPLAPMRPNTERGSISNETSWTARTFRRRLPDQGAWKPAVNALETSRTTSGRERSSREEEEEDISSPSSVRGTERHGRESAADGGLRFG